MTAKLKSGNARLDEVLGGGLPANAISMIVGLPGTGKTIMSQQFVFGNATEERPAIYFSTVTEPIDKIVRFGQTLDFFDVKAIGRSVLYEGLADALDHEGLRGVLDQIAKELRGRKPSLVVIDSFKALRAFSDGDGEFRRFLHDLTGHLGAFPVASLWVGEYDGSELRSAPEFAVADAIVELQTARFAERDTRLLQVLKLRGSGFRSGRHAYRLDTGGLNLFPRLADAPVHVQYDLGAERVSSGIAVLDDVLNQGYWAGSSTLVIGPSGIGKTIMGVHFAFNGAREGQPALLATLQENPTQLEREVSRFGWSLNEPGIHVMYRSPVDVYADEWVYELVETVASTGARRVVIDGIGELRAAAADDLRFREFVYSILQRFSRTGVSLMMTLETPELFALERLTEYGISHLSDNVVLLSYVRDGSTINRTMSVLKTRAAEHEPHTRRYVITKEGIVFSEDRTSRD